MRVCPSRACGVCMCACHVGDGDARRAAGTGTPSRRPVVRQHSAIPDLSATVPRDPALTTVVLPNGFRVHHMHCPVPPERIFMRLVRRASSGIRTRALGHGLLPPLSPALRQLPESSNYFRMPHTPLTSLPTHPVPAVLGVQVVEAGSLHEAVDQRGAAHFVECVPLSSSVTPCSVWGWAIFLELRVLCRLSCVCVCVCLLRAGTCASAARQLLTTTPFSACWPVLGHRLGAYATGPLHKCFLGASWMIWCRRVWWG